MNRSIKIIAVLVLLVGINVLSFGDTFSNFGIGLYRFNEQYPDEDYSREYSGVDLYLALKYYPPKFPLGFFMQATVGKNFNGYEWKGNNMGTIDDDSINDIRLSMGPSVKLFPGRMIVVPLSIGPVFSMYWEENYSSSFDKNVYYEAYNIGLLADTSIIINLGSRAFISSGFSFSWDFFRAERGLMEMEYRQTHNKRIKSVDYYSFTGAIYTGFGVRYN